MEEIKKGKYDRLIKILQIASAVFMVIMVGVMVFLMIKYDVKPSNAKAFVGYLSGGAVTAACMIILFSVVKSFALVFPPAVIYAVSGIFFENYFAAVGVNLIATALSLFLPFFLGKFTGKSMVDSLTKRFPKIKKLDELAGENEFALVFIVKASGMLPCDLTSLLFGAMDMSFIRYIIASNLGMLPLNLLWTLLGNKGDLTNPLSFLYVLPIPVFAVAATLILGRMKKRTKNNPDINENV